MIKNKRPDWNQYIKDTAGYPPSPLLIKAIDYVIDKQQAIDIGGGNLKDAKYLLAQGFETTVIDQADETAKIAKAITSNKLHCHITSFTDYNFPINKFDLVSAMYALPFNPPRDFNKVFDNIKKSLITGGIFSGNFFGIHDDWSNKGNLTFHTKTQIRNLLSDFKIILFEEKEYDGKLASGKPKHWHIFNVIAQKR